MSPEALYLLQREKTQFNTCTHATHTYMHAHTHVHTCTYTHMCTLSHTHTHTHTHVYIHNTHTSHTCTHLHIHTHTCTHTHMCTQDTISYLSFLADCTSIAEVNQATVSNAGTLWKKNKPQLHITAQ